MEFNNRRKIFLRYPPLDGCTCKNSATFYGMDIEKVPVSPQYPTGYIYTRKALDPTRQCAWKDYMYYLPVTVTDTYKMKNFAFCGLVI